MANGVDSQNLRTGTGPGSGFDPAQVGVHPPPPSVPEDHSQPSSPGDQSQYGKGNGHAGAPAVARPLRHALLTRAGSAPAPVQTGDTHSFPIYEFKKGDLLIFTTNVGETRRAAEVVDVIFVDGAGRQLPEPMVRVQFANLHVPPELRGELKTVTSRWATGFITSHGLHLERKVYNSDKCLDEWVKVDPPKAKSVQAEAEEMAQRVRALRLAFDPQFRKQEALKGHLDELTAERKDLDSAYKEWLKSQEDRVSVSLRRAARLGKHDALDTEQYVNPEEKARWKQQFARLDRQIKSTRLALKNVEAKKPVGHKIPDNVLWDDPLVIRMALEEKNKRPITPEEDLDIEFQRMMREQKRGDWEGTLLSYASLQARYLAHADGILKNEAGLTLTSRINTLIRRGVIKTPLTMVLTSGDLEAILPEIDAYNLAVAKKIGEARRTNPHAEALYRGDFLDVRQVHAEIARLQALEVKNRGLSSRLREAEKMAHKILVEHRDSPEVARIKGFARGVLEVADDPNTWIMVLAGMVSGGLAGAVETRVVAAGVNAKKLNMAKPLFHGVAFHATFNLTQHAMLRHDQADWSAGAFSHSVAVMWWLGRVQKFYGAKVVPQYADFLAKRPAVLRTLNFCGSKTAEVTGLASLDIALATAHEGVGHLTAKNIGAHLASSAQFVIAFGALNAGRSHGGKRPEQRGFELAKARFEKDGTPEARRKMLEAQKTYLAHEIEQLEMAQGMQPDKRAGLKVAERFRRVELAKVEILQALEKLDQAKRENPADAENLARTEKLLRDQLAILEGVEQAYQESFERAKAEAEAKVTPPAKADPKPAVKKDVTRVPPAAEAQATEAGPEVVESLEARRIRLEESIPLANNIVRAAEELEAIGKTLPEDVAEVKQLAEDYIALIHLVLRSESEKVADELMDAKFKLLMRVPETPLGIAFKEHARVGRLADFLKFLEIHTPAKTEKVPVAYMDTLPGENPRTVRGEDTLPVTDDMIVDEAGPTQTPPEEVTRDINLLGRQHALASERRRAVEAELASMPESAKIKDKPELWDRVVSLLVEGKIKLDDINRARGMGLDDVREMEFLSHRDNLGPRPGWLLSFAKDPLAFRDRMNNLLKIYRSAQSGQRARAPVVRKIGRRRNHGPDVLRANDRTVNGYGRPARARSTGRRASSEAGSSNVEVMAGLVTGGLSAAAGAIAGLFGRAPKPAVARTLPVNRVEAGPHKVPTVRLFAVDAEKDNDIIVPGWERFTLGRNTHDLPSVQEGDKLVVGITDRRTGKSGKSQISREHFSIRKTKDGWVLFDEGSRYGTEIKQRGSKHWRKLESGERAPLEPGDQIRLAKGAGPVWVFGVEGEYVDKHLSNNQVAWLRNQGMHDLTHSPVVIEEIFKMPEASKKSAEAKSILAILIRRITAQDPQLKADYRQTLKKEDYDPDEIMAVDSKKSKHSTPRPDLGKKLKTYFDALPPDSPFKSELDNYLRVHKVPSVEVMTAEDVNSLLATLVLRAETEIHFNQPKPNTPLHKDIDALVDLTKEFLGLGMPPLPNTTVSDIFGKVEGYVKRGEPIRESLEKGEPAQQVPRQQQVPFRVEGPRSPQNLNADAMRGEIRPDNAQVNDHDAVTTRPAYPMKGSDIDIRLMEGLTPLNTPWPREGEMVLPAGRELSEYEIVVNGWLKGEPMQVKPVDGNGLLSIGRVTKDNTPDISIPRTEKDISREHGWLLYRDGTWFLAQAKAKPGEFRSDATAIYVMKRGDKVWKKVGDEPMEIGKGDLIRLTDDSSGPVFTFFIRPKTSSPNPGSTTTGSSTKKGFTSAGNGAAARPSRPTMSYHAGAFLRPATSHEGAVAPVTVVRHVTVGSPPPGDPRFVVLPDGRRVSRVGGGSGPAPGKILEHAFARDKEMRTIIERAAKRYHKKITEFNVDELKAVLTELAGRLQADFTKSSDWNTLLDAYYQVDHLMERAYAGYQVTLDQPLRDKIAEMGFSIGFVNFLEDRKGRGDAGVAIERALPKLGKKPRQLAKGDIPKLLALLAQDIWNHMKPEMAKPVGDRNSDPFDEARAMLALADWSSRQGVEVIPNLRQSPDSFEKYLKVCEGLRTHSLEAEKGRRLAENPTANTDYPSGFDPARASQAPRFRLKSRSGNLLAYESSGQPVVRINREGSKKGESDFAYPSVRTKSKDGVSRRLTESVPAEIIFHDRKFYIVPRSSDARIDVSGHTINGATVIQPGNDIRFGDDGPDSMAPHYIFEINPQ